MYLTLVKEKGLDPSMWEICAREKKKVLPRPRVRVRLWAGGTLPHGRVPFPRRGVPVPSSVVVCPFLPFSFSSQMKKETRFGGRGTGPRGGWRSWRRGAEPPSKSLKEVAPGDL